MPYHGICLGLRFPAEENVADERAETWSVHPLSQVPGSEAWQSSGPVKSLPLWMIWGQFLPLPGSQSPNCREKSRLFQSFPCPDFLWLHQGLGTLASPASPPLTPPPHLDLCPGRLHSLASELILGLLMTHEGGSLRWSQPLSHMAFKFSSTQVTFSVLNPRCKFSGQRI